MKIRTLCPHYFNSLDRLSDLPGSQRVGSTCQYINLWTSTSFTSWVTGKMAAIFEIRTLSQRYHQSGSPQWTNTW